jgi:hypothetical protein
LNLRIKGDSIFEIICTLSNYLQILNIFLNFQNKDDQQHKQTLQTTINQVCNGFPPIIYTSIQLSKWLIIDRLLELNIIDFNLTYNNRPIFHHLLIKIDSKIDIEVNLVIKAIKTTNVDIGLRDVFGNTVFHHVAMKKSNHNEMIVDELLRKFVNVKNGDDETAGDIATRNGWNMKFNI